MVADDRGLTPIDWAAAYNKLDVLNVLLSTSTKSTPTSPDSALGSIGTTSSPYNTSAETVSGLLRKF
ncbi:unnamed protein product [Strongylus vulgaris]|uniref:Uncharacterized protein n=1 Tax=Strongylus vulgaris TaxID=40348 RepID=A0A3P7IJT4_STRVU|nr:unnamed protein product [Strongylus vulgaris]